MAQVSQVVAVIFSTVVVNEETLLITTVAWSHKPQSSQISYSNESRPL